MGADLFQLKGVSYLLIVHYFCRYPELIKYTTTTCLSVMNVLKVTFARHGIPAIRRSDNEPQFDLPEMKSFALSYGFGHKQSSQDIHRVMDGWREVFKQSRIYSGKLMMSLSLSVGISVEDRYTTQTVLKPSGRL